jgi:alanine racemase
VAKDFTQREGIDYNKTFSPISSNDSFRIIMTLVTHYDLELYHMDVKTIFLNGDLYENVYMTQTKGFVIEGKIKSIYELKQASRQWYLKFDETVRKFGFKKNDENNCIYAKFKNQKIIFLILISSHFDMKDLGEASYVLKIEIHRDRRKEVLGLSQK